MRKPIYACALLVLYAARAAAVDWSALKPQGFVSDFARVIDEESRRRLEEFSRQVEKAGIEMAFVTLPSLAGEPVEDVANLLYRKWGVGKKGKDEGILLLLSIQDRRSRLEVGYGLEPYLTDGDAGSILRSMAPYLREGRYGDAMLQAAHAIAQEVSKAKGITIAAPEPPKGRREPDSPVPVAVILGGFILFAVLSALIGGGRRRRWRRSGGFGGFLPGIILGNMMGRSIDFRHGGGGFGGFDSSDGFGGFGGGDSGGGGASSTW